MKVMYEIEICKMVTKDNYEHGEIGKTSDFGIIATNRLDNLPDATEILKDYSDNPAIILDNRVAVQATENDHGVRPTSFELEQFKRGQINLYSVTYTAYITRMILEEFTHTQLLVHFPTLENLGE